jgi:hypothetical protein
MPRIEEFFLPTDGNDWLPAINRAQQEFHTPGNPTGTPGFTLEFGPSEYFFSDTIRLVRSMRLVGAAGKMFSTVFKFAADKGGILCTWELSGTDQFRSDTSLIERITLQGGGGTSATAHGITMQVKVALRDLAIVAFPGDGIHIEATHPVGNANNWQISNVQINNCSGDGLSATGADANSGYANLLVCQDNAGWAIRDHSAELGNTYISCVAEGKGGGFNTRRVGADSPRSIFINCDVEVGGQSIIDAPAMVINSSIANLAGNAVVFNASGDGAGFSSEVAAVSPVFPLPPPAPAGTGRQVVARLGAHEQVLTALSLSVVEGTIDSQNNFTGKPLAVSNVGNLELIYGYLVPGWWGLYWGRLNGSPLRISTREAEPNVGEAQIWCELGIFFGSTMVHVTASGSTDTAPPSRPGRNAGDIEFNSDPQAGGHVGWVWVVPAGAAAGSWKQFGGIEP